MKRGMFVTLEGCEGCGKSTQSQLLADRIKKELGFSVCIFREPGSDLVAEKIRVILKDTDNQITAQAELLLFEAARAQFVSNLLRPALSENQVVICDRFFDSTIAYQGWGRQIDKDFINQLNMFASSETFPDLTLWLDLPPDLGFSRVGGARDRMENAGDDFHKRVWKGFESIWKNNGQRVSRVFCQDMSNRALGVNEIHRTVWSIFEQKFNEFKEKGSER